MAFSGGVFSRLYSWVTDRDAAVKIRADRMDAEMNGLAAGLSMCLLKDGTQTVTANIPMAGFKLTGLGAAAANGDAVRYEQLFAAGGPTLPGATLASTDAGAGAGPDLTLYRNSPTPAASDIIGRVLFQGEDSAGNTEDYAEDYVTIADPTSTSEDASRLFRIKIAGTMTTVGTASATGWAFIGQDLTHSWSDDSAAFGPNFIYMRETVSPAFNDVIGRIIWRSRDSAGNVQDYASVAAIIVDPTSGTEDGRLDWNVVVNAVVTTRMSITSAGVTTIGLVDLSNAASSQVKFGNANNSADTATLDGYTDWIAYTPTCTGFGTVASVSVWSKRTGDKLCLRGCFTAGTNTGVEARMTLGFNGTNANVNSDATKIPSIQVVGHGYSHTTQSGAAAAISILIESNVGYVTFGSAASGFWIKANGTAFTNSAPVYFTAEIPISGW